MRPSDLPAVDAVARAVHPDFPEDPAVFAERLALYPPGCLALCRIDGRGLESVIAYAISHPGRLAEPPALNILLEALPAAPTTYYIHDLAILSEARGHGAAATLVAKLLDHARTAGFARASLIAVGGSARFWQRHGFVARPDVVSAGKLASYGSNALHMERELAGPSPGATLFPSSRVML
ncbi:GNAT family N-acetyltransferase [Chelatococcus reniformis]|uniref:N-acetyltransferase n=1 Tax=Chelatococcus reniformis TaxID=1494448 RepID=A0A916UH33_9HYPH|nr:GNAT family N-acetyltransferase [Chelatococcus reniformis]GGC73132.1 N-acetyltransferase [Chelatococcus reniformis]